MLLIWRVDRVDEGSGFESRRGESFRGFESHTLLPLNKDVEL